MVLSANDVLCLDICYWVDRAITGFFNEDHQTTWTCLGGEPQLTVRDKILAICVVACYKTDQQKHNISCVLKSDIAIDIELQTAGGS